MDTDGTDAGLDDWETNSVPDHFGQPPVAPLQDPMESGPSTHSPSVHWGAADENQCS